MRRALLVVFLYYAPAAHGASSARPAEELSDGYQALDMEARSIMGELKMQSGDMSGARRDYGRSLELGRGVDTPKDDVAALNHYRTAEIALQRGEFGDAKRHLDILVTRYPRTEWGERGLKLLQTMPGDSLRKPEQAEADEPFVPAMPSSTPEEALGRLRAAVDSERIEDGLAEGYDFRRRYPDHPARAEVELACAALHLRRGEAARAARLLQPVAAARGPLRGRAIHLLGAAFTALGRDADVLKAVPDADASAVADRWVALAQIWRAGAEERLGQREEAYERYRAVSAAGHDSPVKAHALAAVAADWDRKGRPARARDALARAAKEAARWGLDDVRESATLSSAHLLRREGKPRRRRRPTRISPRVSRAARCARARCANAASCSRSSGSRRRPSRATRRSWTNTPARCSPPTRTSSSGSCSPRRGKASRSCATKAMAKASEAKDADLEALLLMAQVHYNKKRYRDAIPLYKRYLENAAPGPKTKEVAGLLLNSVWQADRDDPELPALVAQCPDHPLVRVIRRDLAAGAYKRGDWAGAEQLLRQQIETDPKSPRVHDWLCATRPCASSATAPTPRTPTAASSPPPRPRTNAAATRPRAWAPCSSRPATTPARPRPTAA